MLTCDGKAHSGVHRSVMAQDERHELSRSRVEKHAGGGRIVSNASITLSAARKLLRTSHCAVGGKGLHKQYIQAFNASALVSFLLWSSIISSTHTTSIVCSDFFSAPDRLQNQLEIYFTAKKSLWKKVESPFGWMTGNDLRESLSEAPELLETIRGISWLHVSLFSRPCLLLEHIYFCVAVLHLLLIMGRSQWRSCTQGKNSKKKVESTHAPGQAHWK